MMSSTQPTNQSAPTRARPADTFKRILVHVGVDRPSQDRVGVAVKLAERFGGKLTGVHVPKLILPALLGPAEVPPTLLAEQVARPQEDGESAKRRFRDQAAQRGLSADWHVLKVDVIPELKMVARYMDISILGQPGPDAPEADFTIRPEEIALGSGRPVLIVPYIGAPPEIGSCIVIAWDGGREAARAVADAMPLLRQATSVWVTSVDVDAGALNENSTPAKDLCGFLADHGIAARPEHLGADETQPAEVMLSLIADLGADLLVMGCYGHTRLRELILGGMTRDILRHMTIPVLMSH